MSHPALVPHAVAVITGGASGIGLAAASHFAKLGLKVCIADHDADNLARAAELLTYVAPGGSADIMSLGIDVSHRNELERLEAAVRGRFGGTDVLINNAGIGPDSTILGPLDHWQRLLGVNLWGIINGTQVFAPTMIARKRPGLIINTRSKQGITTPPGNPAYNVSKAGVKAFTEALAHELRNTPGLRDHGASPDPRLRVHGIDRARPRGKTRGCVDGGADGGFHAGTACGERLLHSLPGQRRAACAR